MGFALAPDLTHRFVDGDGNALGAGLLYTYVSGTTTPQATYTDVTGGTPNANPIVLDQYGQCNLWLDTTLTYTFVVKDAFGTTLKTIDGVASASGTGGSGRTALTANQNYYVDATLGNDANDGSIGAPWKRIDYAAGYICYSLDLSGFHAIVNIVDGDYTDNDVALVECVGAAYLSAGLGRPNNWSVQFIGNVATPSAVKVNTFTAIDAPSTRFLVDGVQVGAASLYAFYSENALIHARNVTLVGDSATQALWTGRKGVIEIFSGLHVDAPNLATLITAGVDSHVYFGDVAFDQALTVSGSLVKAVDSFGYVEQLGAHVYTGSAVTGKKYDLDQASIFKTAAAVPGTVAGTTAHNAQAI